ncbi:uncharacterized protein EDB91DRAFT_1003827, partial [Suillus paluster]|uniref:uncharacterized protein n=1 Tax=Suillus paluster TaxID=48578 RepID=UPI001B86585E
PSIAYNQEKCEPQENHVSILNMITEFKLNTEQARAFSLIAKHSLCDLPEHLCMFLGGAGGTGKSRVISAI